MEQRAGLGVQIHFQYDQQTYQDGNPVTKSPVNTLFAQLNEAIGQSDLRGEAQKTARVAAQGLLNKLDMVARDEFDAQTEVLLRTRSRVEELERQLEVLTQAVEELERSG